MAIYRLVHPYDLAVGSTYGTAHAVATPVPTTPASAPSAAARPTSGTDASTANRLVRFAHQLAYHWIWLGPVMIVTIGLFDLICTISAFEKGWLVEMNPIANAALDYAGAPGLAVYRFAMTALGCVLLTWGMRTYRLRRFVGSVRRVRLVVWTGQAVLLASHLALLGWWIAWLSV